MSFKKALMSVHIMFLLYTRLVRSTTWRHPQHYGAQAYEESRTVCDLCCNNETLSTTNSTSWKRENMELLQCSCFFKHTLHKKCLLKHFITDPTYIDSQEGCLELKEMVLLEIANNIIDYLNNGIKTAPPVSIVEYENFFNTIMFKNILYKSIKSYEYIKTFFEKDRINELNYNRNLKQVILEIVDKFLYNMSPGMIYKILIEEPYSFYSNTFLLNICNSAFYKMLSENQVVAFFTIFRKNYLYNPEEDIHNKYKVLDSYFLNNLMVLRKYSCSTMFSAAILSVDSSFSRIIATFLKHHNIYLMEEAACSLFKSVIKTKKNTYSIIIGFFLIENFENFSYKVKNYVISILEDPLNCSHEENIILKNLLYAKTNKIDKTKEIIAAVDIIIDSSNKNKTIPEDKQMLLLYYYIKTCEWDNDFILKMYEKIFKIQKLSHLTALIVLFEDIKCDVDRTLLFYIDNFSNFLSPDHRIIFLDKYLSDRMDYQMLKRILINAYNIDKLEHTEQEYSCMIRILISKDIYDLENEANANKVIEDAELTKYPIYIQAMQRYFINLPSYQGYIMKNMEELIAYSKYVHKDYVIRYLISLNEYKSVEVGKTFYKHVTKWIKMCIATIEHHITLIHMLRMITQNKDFETYITEPQIQEILNIFNDHVLKNDFLQVFHQEIKNPRILAWIGI